MNERKARALIERHFVEPLPAAEFKRLWAHVSGCAGCKSHYDRLMAFEARADGGKAEVERIGQALFADLEPKKKGLLSGAFAFTWPFPKMIAAGAGLALVLAVVVAPQLRRPDEFAARGEGPGYGPELLATCFRDVEGRLESVQPLDGRVPTPRCPRGGRVAFAYRNARPGEQLVVFAVRGREVSRLFGPEAVPPGEGKRALPRAFAIDPDAPQGDVQLVAVFAPALDVERLAAALAAGAEIGPAAGAGAVVRTVAYHLSAP